MFLSAGFLFLCLHFERVGVSPGLVHAMHQARFLLTPVNLSNSLQSLSACSRIKRQFTSKTISRASTSLDHDGKANENPPVWAWRFHRQHVLPQILVNVHQL